MKNAFVLPVVFVLFLFASVKARAQNAECDQQLSHAENEFNAGHFFAIPSILNECLDKGAYSAEATVRAYLILCQAYMVLDDHTAAENSYLKLLKADPEFVPNEKDHPIDIVYLSKKFTATPIFTPHGRIGLNTSIFRSIYSLSTDPVDLPASTTLGIGFQIGGGIDWNINDNISVCTEVNFATKNYKRTRTGISADALQSDVQTVTGNQSWFDVPLYVKYSKNTGDIRPFGYVGFAFNYLISASNEFLYTDNKPGTGGQLLAEGPNEIVTYQRNQVNRSWLIGGGVKYKWGKDFLYADLRYMGGLSNLANADQLYYEDPSKTDPNQAGNPLYHMSGNVTKYRYASDLFRLDNISLSFGFIHPIYQPRKVKKVRTKSVAREIRKKEGGKKK